MSKIVLMLITAMLVAAGFAYGQEVVITDFPLSVGNSVGSDFFRPYDGKLKAIVDTLHKYPLSFAVITGSADGARFRENNDAKNPGLALGRAHALRNYLIAEFDLDSARLIVQSKDASQRGAPYRSVSIRIVTELTDMNSRLDSLANRPPVEKRVTEVREIHNELTEHLGLQLGAGVSTSPFGGIPIVEAAITWKRAIFLEGRFGYTFWNGSYRIPDATLSTRRRLAGGELIVFPWSRLPLGFVGGWVRIEEISQQYYQYVKLSEGPILGVRVTPLKFLSITGAYNPSRQRQANQTLSSAKNGQFILSATIHKTFGGAR